MSKDLDFNKAKEKYLEKLLQYVPIVNRVHGKKHIEFNEVEKVFNKLYNKIKNSRKLTPNLNQEFSKLQTITNGYEVPSGVCESYSEVYKMLSQLDKSYHKLGD